MSLNMKKFDPQRTLTLEELTDVVKLIGIVVPEGNMDLVPVSLHEHFTLLESPRIVVAK